MKLKRRRYKHEEEAENFWPAFTDMISTVVLILFFLVLVFYMKTIVNTKAINSLSEELADKEEILNQKELALAETLRNLSISKLEMEELLLQKTTLESDLKAGEDELKLAIQSVLNHQMVIEESNKELSSLRAKLEGIAFLRVDLLEKVKASLEKELGSESSDGKQLVTVGDNGNIIINESLVFDLDSSDLKDTGKELLDSIAIAFENVLDDDSIRANVDAISIQGHTDTRSSHEYNRELSARRAYTVVDYLMESNPNLADVYGSYFAASAYSEFRPLDLGSSEASHSKNRRIEIAVILKDSNIQNVINQYLKESMENFNTEEEEEDE